MKLAELQRGFRDWLVDSSRDASLSLSVGKDITPGLAVYQNNYRSQLVGCLQVSFPLLRIRLGEEAFLEAAITHIDRHPPHAWTLDVYGFDFVNTLQEMFPHNPDLHELAWIEWAMSESFVASDAPLITNDELSKIDWDTARLHLSPSLRQRTATTNAEAIWSALQEEIEAPESEMLDAPCGLLVWRRGFTSQLKRVDVVEHAALMSLRDDDRFSVFCDALLERLGEGAGMAKAGALLADWLAAGIVASVGQDG